MYQQIRARCFRCHLSSNDDIGHVRSEMAVHLCGMTDELGQRIRARVRDVSDFPRPGVLFKDITPLLADPVLFPQVIAAMARPFDTSQITHVVAIESRGFFFGMPVALTLGASFVPARKPGKLPRPTVDESYDLEYGRDALAIHADAFGRGDRVLLIDDVLATGGTAAAGCRIVDRMGGDLVAVVVLAEIVALGGRVKMPARRIDSLVQY